MSSWFQVTLPVDSAAPDVLGVWQAMAGGVSFDATAAGVETALYWRVSLPSDPWVASTSMAEQEWLLGRAGQAVPNARKRLKDFIAQYPRAKGEDFAINSRSQAQPEQELALLLMQVEAPASFSGSQNKFVQVRELAEEARRFVQQVEDTLRCYAQIETFQDGVLLARTRFDWTGDAHATSSRVLRRDQVALHSRSVDVALQTRIGWIRLATHFAQSVLLVSAGLLSANPVLIVGGFWKFFKDVLAEWQELQAVTSSQ